MSSAELSHASTQTESRTKSDCLACKLVGSAAFVGVGLYALQVAHRDGTFAKVRPPGGSVIGGRLAALMGVGKFILVPHDAPSELHLDHEGFLGLGAGRLAM